MADVSIKETFTLPSKGLVYGVSFDPKVTIRSMTTMEELKRYGATPDNEYRIMSEIIESCIEEKLPIHVYDMCLGDYNFLLHKLRVVTYGKDYKMFNQCPKCNSIVNSTVDLDTMKVLEFDAENMVQDIILPVSQKTVKLNLITPRMLDSIKERAKDQQQKNKDDYMDYELLYLTMAYIKEYDGKVLNDVLKEALIRKSVLKDVKYIIQKGDELNGKVGLDNKVIAKCPKCGYKVVTTFRFGPEFWEPSFDN